MGRARIVEWDIPRVEHRTIAPSDVDAELARFRHARERAVQEVHGVREAAAGRIGVIEAKVFESQALMIEDPDLVEGTEAYISDNFLSAERAFDWQLIELRLRMLDTGHALVMDRLADLRDVRLRVLSQLLNRELPSLTPSPGGDPAILLTDELPPSLAVSLDPEGVAGFVTAAFTLQCGRRPEGTCGGLTGVSCTVFGSCGNGTVETGEECDDGNNIDCDGCDRNCRLTSCGNARICPPEECDDGNTRPGDGCDENCTLEFCGDGVLDPFEECDDGCLTGVPNVCEPVDDCDGCDSNCSLTRCGNAIVCPPEECDDGNDDDGDGCSANCLIGEGCLAAPLMGCLSPGGSGKSQLQIKDQDADGPGSKDKIQWKWLKGPALSQADFGDPLNPNGPDFKLCIYAGATPLLIVEMQVPSGGTCGTKACWKPISTKGYKYGDKTLSSDGVKKLLLKGDGAGKSKLLIQGKDGNLPLPGLPLDPNGPVIAQLSSSDPNRPCYEETFLQSNVTKNNSTQFKAKTP